MNKICLAQYVASQLKSLDVQTKLRIKAQINNPFFTPFSFLLQMIIMQTVCFWWRILQNVCNIYLRQKHESGFQTVRNTIFVDKEMNLFNIRNLTL